MKWLTWEQVGVDRMGCAWLIKRFIDPAAEFQFMPAGQKSASDEAEAFDIPGARLSHRRGRSTFSTMLTEYKLNDPILERMARIVDEADVVQEVVVEAASAGLDQICRGIRLISADDWTALERGAMVYEALYASLKEE